MEFWLSFNNNEEQLRLPVPPPSFSITKGNKITTVDIANLGEIGLIGNGLLSTISISSFFPNQEYSFVQYRGFPSPYECVKLIEKWRNSKKPIRFLITDTDINMACSIETFTYGEQDGTRDVYFDLVLKEYRFITVKSTTTNTTTSSGTTKQVTKRPATKTNPKTYVVKAGDTLWQLAVDFYGKGSEWQKIANKNGIKNPRALKVGQKLVIP